MFDSAYDMPQKLDFREALVDRNLTEEAANEVTSNLEGDQLVGEAPMSIA